MTGRRLGILTAGGDCAGLNAAVRAVVRTACVEQGAEVMAFRDGFRGLVEGDAMPLGYDDVANILTQGGTILGTSRDHVFGLGDSPSRGPNRIQDALDVFHHHRLDCLVCIGGEGTLTVATALAHEGLPIVGLPKTIDNDVAETDRTVGFDTAVSVVAEAIGRLRSTAASHHRVMVVETMGRSAGWVALQAGLVTGADVILIPEIPFSLDVVCDIVRRRVAKGRRYSIVALAEGAGKAMALAEKLEAETGLEARGIVLGHLQRGGTPTPCDRLLATRLGWAAARTAIGGRHGTVVCWQRGDTVEVALGDIAGRRRLVEGGSSLVTLARAMGTSFGDA